MALAYFGTFWAWHFNFLNPFVFLRITDEGSVPEMRIPSILLIKSDLKLCIHLSSLSWYMQCHYPIACIDGCMCPLPICSTRSIFSLDAKWNSVQNSNLVTRWTAVTKVLVGILGIDRGRHCIRSCFRMSFNIWESIRLFHRLPLNIHVRPFHLERNQNHVKLEACLGLYMILIPRSSAEWPCTKWSPMKEYYSLYSLILIEFIRWWIIFVSNF